MTIHDLIAALGRVKVYDALVSATPAIAAAIQDKLAPYPPAGHGNQARAWASGGQNSWYVRGSGSRWVVKSGAVHGNQNSQTMGRRWSISRLPNGSVLGNTATYAQYVLGSKQTATMKRIGWTNARTAVTEVIQSGVIAQIISRALAHAFSQAGAGK